MAVSAAEVRYASNGVYGNVAYDMDRVVGGYAMPGEETYSIPVPRPDERTRERVRERTAVRTQEKAAYGVPVVGILGFLVTAVLMVVVLMSYVQMAELSDEANALENSISQLQEENKQLQADYATTFNLNEIKSYAINNLGMSEISEDNVSIIGTERGDKAEILNEDDASKGFFQKIADFFASIPEYFK